MATIPYPKPPPFRPIHYIPASSTALILSQRISVLLVVAHAQFTPPPSLSTSSASPPTNHWSFYAIPTNNDGTTTSDSSTPSSSSAIERPPIIHIDCQPSHSEPSTVLRGGSKANLIISVLDNNTTKIETVDPRTWPHLIPLLVNGEKITVGDLVELLVKDGRERYEFDEIGVGCRFWVLGVVDLLQNSGILSANDRKLARDEGERLWPGDEVSPIDRGVLSGAEKP